MIFENEQVLLKAKQALNDKSIFPRRYFYPSLNTLNFVDNKKMIISEDISSRILCLPLYCGLTKSELKEICTIVNINLC